MIFYIISLTVIAIHVAAAAAVSKDESDQSTADCDA
jgi:hypothetical protein